MKLSGLKQIGFLILLTVECLAVILIFRHFYGYRSQNEFTSSGLQIEKVLQSAEPGNVVDKTYTGSERAVTTPAMSLNNGIYQVTVSYDSDNPYTNPYDTSAVWSFAKDVENQARYTVESDKTELPGYKKSVTYLFYVHEHSTGVSIHNVVADNSDVYLKVNNVTVTYLPAKSAAYYLIWILFWTGIIDLILYAWLLRRKETADWFMKHGVVLAVMAGVVFISETPMMLDYIFGSHDLPFHCYRIQELAEGLESGMFPVKIQPGWMNGYGYATGVFYGDALLYFPAILKVAGFPLRVCYKMYVLLINILTVYISYRCAAKIAKDRYLGLLGCMVYSFSPYRLCNLYTRAAVGEYTAMAFLPLLMLGFWMIYTDGEEKTGTVGMSPIKAADKDGGRGWIVLTLGATGIIESHVITTLMAAIFGVLFCLLMWKRTFKKSVLGQFLKFAMSTLLLNSFFLVPFFDYYTHTLLHGADYKGVEEVTTEFAATLFSTVYGTNGVGPEGNYIGGMPLSLGFAGGMVLASSLALLFRRQYGKHMRGAAVLLLITFFSIIMCTNYFPYRFVSLHLKPVYDVLYKMQFPWRFLIIATLLIYVLLVIGMRTSAEIYGRNKVLLIGLLICITAGYQAVTLTSQYLNDNRYEKDKMFTYVGIGDSFRQSGAEYVIYGTDFSKMTDADLQVSDVNSMQAAITYRKGVTIVSKVGNNSGAAGYADYPLQNYRGYHAEDDSGRELAISNGDNNRVRVTIPAGYSGTVKVFFREPAYWRVAEIVSLLTAVWFILKIFYPHRKFSLARKGGV